MKSLWVYFWYVKIPQRGYMEHGLEYITFYVLKKLHKAPVAICSNPPLVRDKPLGAHAFVGLAYWVLLNYSIVNMNWISVSRYGIGQIILREQNKMKDSAHVTVQWTPLNLRY